MIRRAGARLPVEWVDADQRPEGGPKRIMSATDFLVRRVLDEVRPMLTPDGGGVELLSFDAGIVRVKYDKGHNDKCVECVMPPEDFREYLMEILQSRVRDVVDVEVTSA